MKWWQVPHQIGTILQQPGLIATLVRGASAALIIQTLGAGVGYLTQVLLARWLGAAEYGIYDYVITLSTVLAFVAGLGLPGAVLRFIPAYIVQQNWALLRGLILGSWWQTLLASLVTATIATGLVLWLDNTRDLAALQPSLRPSLLMGIWLIPLLALMKLQLEMARSMRHISLAYAPFFVVYPALLMVTAWLWLQTQEHLTSVSTIVLSALMLLLVVVGQFWCVYRKLPSETIQVRPAYAVRQWLLVALPLLFIDGSFIILNQTDTLMIAAFLGTKQVGIYGAAFKTAGWVSFILVAVNAIAAPMFASLYAEGDRQALQQLVSIIARWMFYPALLVALGLIVFAEPVLYWFGAEFVAAKWSLVALVLGQLVNVGAGSVGYLLIMTGHHNPCARVVAYSAIVNVVLNLIGIPTLGIFGAAIATALSMTLWNIWLNALVVKYLGVNPSIWAAFRRQT